MTQWDFKNKGTLTSPTRLSFVLKVSLRHLRPSVIYSVPCDRILQRAYLAFSLAFAAFAVNVDLEISNDPAKIQIRELSLKKT